jgi:hypothetical protein
MTLQIALTSGLTALGLAPFGLAIRHERMMQRHRQPGVSYRDVTMRRDGGWRQADLFTPQGLAHQRRASTFGILGALLWIAAVVAWITTGLLSI